MHDPVYVLNTLTHTRTHTHAHTHTHTRTHSHTLTHRSANVLLQKTLQGHSILVSSGINGIHWQCMYARTHTHAHTHTRTHTHTNTHTSNQPKTHHTHKATNHPHKLSNMPTPTRSGMLSPLYTVLHSITLYI